MRRICILTLRNLQTCGTAHTSKYSARLPPCKPTTKYYTVGYQKETSAFTRRGCTSSSGADFGAISRDFERKILRPRKSFEIFGRESHKISRAAACRRSAQLLWTSKGRKQAAHHRAAWLSARSHAVLNEKFCGREKFFKNFDPKCAANRTESHTPRRADAQHHV